MVPMRISACGVAPSFGGSFGAVWARSGANTISEATASNKGCLVARNFIGRSI
jgi:hypothetical protein